MAPLDETRGDGPNGDQPNGAKRRRYVVVGAGFAGLAAAHALCELGCENVTLLEAGDRVGGSVGTHQDGDALIEAGADMFITDKPWAVDLAKRVGIGDRLVGLDNRNRRSLVLFRGSPTPIPPGFMLMSPGRIRPFLRSPLLTARGKARVLREPLVPIRREGSDESIGAFVRRRFGSELLERIVQPLVGGIYTGDPDNLSLAATLPRFLDMERRGSVLLESVRKARAARAEASGEKDLTSVTNGASVSGARYGLFASFPGGMRELIDATEKVIAEAGATVEFGSAVTQIERLDSGTFAVSTKSRAVLADAVVLAVPAYVASSLISPWAPTLADDLSALQYASSAVVTSVHRLTDIEHPLDAFGLVIPHREKRQVLAVSFASRKLAGRVPDGQVLLRTFVGGALNPGVLERGDTAIEQMVEEELADMLGVKSCISRQVWRYDRAMPQYEIGHLSRLAKLSLHLDAHPRLALAGNGYRGVGIPDTIHSGEQAARRVFGARLPTALSEARP